MQEKCTDVTGVGVSTLLLRELLCSIHPSINLSSGWKCTHPEFSQSQNVYLPFPGVNYAVLQPLISPPHLRNTQPCWISRFFYMHFFFRTTCQIRSFSCFIKSPSYVSCMCVCVCVLKKSIAEYLIWSFNSKAIWLDL